ncbi:hypothetical protein KEM55_005633 [Ascosphaera atra]|nr:hypothetical protein KEM55_005633 [Ascosphaera atra]
MASKSPQLGSRRASAAHGPSRVASPATTAGKGMMTATTTNNPSVGVSRPITPHENKGDPDKNIIPEFLELHLDGEPPVPFPPPQTFDILPPLHDLLDRLLSAPSPGNPQQGNGLPGAEHLIPGAANHPHAQHPQAPASGSLAPSMAGGAGGVDPRTLLVESSAVKLRLQKARAALDPLPDMQRSIEEQQEEMEELEARIKRLKGVMADFGQRSAGVLKEGV